MDWLKEEWSTLTRSTARRGIGVLEDYEFIVQMSVWNVDGLSLGDMSSEIVVRLAVVKSEASQLFTVLAVQKYPFDSDDVIQCCLWFEGVVFDEVAEVIEWCQVVPETRVDVEM